MLRVPLDKQMDFLVSYVFLIFPPNVPLLDFYSIWYATARTPGRGASATLP